MGSLITYENLEDGQKVTANIFNERFAQVIAQINGKLSAVHMENAGITKEKLAAEVYESIYPVGSMYVNFTDNTNPATLLGFGTWSAVEGRMVVGYDGTQTEFNAAEKTGGHKKLQAHTHAITNGAGDTFGFARMSSLSGERLSTGGNGARIKESYDTIASAGDGNGENLPPYIVGYVWKRTS